MGPLIQFKIQRSSIVNSKSVYYNKRERKQILFKKEIFDEIFLKHQPREFTIKKMIDLYKLKDNSFSFSTSTFTKYLKKTCKYKYGKPKIMNKAVDSPRSKKMMILLINRIAKAFNKNKTLIFYDESGFMNKKRQLKSWIPRDKFYIFKTGGRLKSKNLRLAITKNKVLHSVIDGKHTNETLVLEFFKGMINEIQKDEFLKDQWEMEEYL